MAYGEKYTMSYKRLSDNTTSIEIWQRDYTGAVTDLAPGDHPLEISFDGNTADLFNPTNGTGASIGALVTPLTVLDLYTEDPQEFMVYVYHGSELRWKGYITTELYSEDYSMSADILTPITIECNDGMSLLEDITYIDLSTGAYTGFTSLGDVLKNVMSKLEHTYDYIVTNTDIQVDSTHTNLFTGLTLNNNQFYDESGEPQTCRTVLNSVLGGLGLIMELSKDNIIIYEPSKLSGTTANTYTFDSGYVYTEGSGTLGGIKAIGTDVPWFETGQSLDIVKGFNEFSTSYDPYTITELGFDFDNSDNAPSVGSWVTGYTGSDKTYQYTETASFSGWTQEGPSYFGGLGEIVDNENITDQFGPKSYFIRVGIAVLPNPDYYFEYTFPNSDIIQDDNLYMELSMDAYINTLDEFNIYTPTGTTTLVATAYVGNIVISIGDHSWNAKTGRWSTSSSTANGLYVRQSDADFRTEKRTEVTASKGLGGRRNYYTYHVPLDESVINDTWTRSSMLLDLSDDVIDDGPMKGPIKIKIFDETNPSFYDEYNVLLSDSIAENVLLQNPTISFVNREKNYITNEGLETFGTLPAISSYVKRSNMDIKLQTGTGTYGVSKGAYSSPESTPEDTIIEGLYRAEYGDTNKTQWFVVQQYLSQYQKPRKVLNVNLDVKDVNFFGVRYYLLTDTYLPGLQFFFINGKYDDKNESCSGELLEISDGYEEIA